MERPHKEPVFGTTVSWLLEDPDPALRYQVHRDLLETPERDLASLRNRISESHWIQELLSHRKPDGNWGHNVYNPKWTCTHYVLSELVQLEAPRDSAQLRESAASLLTYPEGSDGGINYAKTVDVSDVCINGMILTIVSYFGVENDRIARLVDYLLRVRMGDGGWNCVYHQGAVHSSLHTTISVVEGFLSIMGTDSDYRRREMEGAVQEGIEFILRHRLYRSERTGEVIRDEFLKFPFPVRWKYDVLRCLDLFARYRIPYDERMAEGADIVEKAANGRGKWKSASQPGKTYFVREKNGSEGRWNTLRALRILKFYS